MGSIRGSHGGQEDACVHLYAGNICICPRGRRAGCTCVCMRKAFVGTHAGMRTWKRLDGRVRNACGSRDHGRETYHNVLSRGRTWEKRTHENERANRIVEAGRGAVARECDGDCVTSPHKMFLYNGAEVGRIRVAKESLQRPEQRDESAPALFVDDAISMNVLWR